MCFESRELLAVPVGNLAASPALLSPCPARWPPGHPASPLTCCLPAPALPCHRPALPCPAPPYPADEVEARAQEIEDDDKQRLEAAVPEAQPAGLLESAGCEHLSESAEPEPVQCSAVAPGALVCPICVGESFWPTSELSSNSCWVSVLAHAALLPRPMSLLPLFTRCFLPPLQGWARPTLLTPCAARATSCF